MSILIVEDNEDSRVLLEKLFGAHGYQVMSASNGQEAMDFLANLKPDLIISDILMPKMDGYALCRQIKNDDSLKGIPFIFYTATYRDEQSRQLGLSLGACHFIIKPLEPSKLLAMVEEVIREHRLEKETLTDEANHDSLHLEFEEKYSEVLAKKLDKKIFDLNQEKKKLRTSEQKYRNLVESLQNEYFFYSYDTDGVFTYLSPSIENILGYSPEEFYSNYSKYLIRAFGNNDFGRHAPVNISGEQQPPYDVEIAHKNGMVRSLEVTEVPIFDENGAVIEIEGIAHDVTARKQADLVFQTLVESIAGHTGTELFETIVKGLCDLFECSCAILGLYEDTEVKVLSMQLNGKMINEYSYTLKGTPCENVKENGFCYFPENITGLFPEDKTVRELNAVGYVGIPVNDKEGKPVGVLCALSSKKLVLPERGKDIMEILEARASAEIERLMVDRELKKAQESFLQVQKLEAIGTLAGGIAHDFNNILSAIYGYTELTKFEIGDNAKAQENLKQVLSAAERAKKLVHQILAFSRKSDHEKNIVEITPIVKETIKMLRSSIPSTILIDENIGSHAKVLADPTQIHQVVMNLCTNAYHAMRQTGGKLTIDLYDDYIGDDNLPLPDFTPGHYLILKVNDTGVGIDSATKEKIFEPYFTTKNAEEGTGLGLSVVHGIIQECRGHITVSSLLGQGTTFQIYLPVAEGEVFEESSENDDLPVISGGNERIMFVDDEQIILTMAQGILSAVGYSVSIFSDGAEAWDEFQQNQHDYDIVVTDMTMPYMTGLELAEKIIALTPRMPVVLCTGHSELTTREGAMKMGIRGYCEKPFTSKDLLAIVRNLLDAAKLKGTRILLVDDMQFNAELCAQVLENIGCVTTVEKCSKKAFDLFSEAPEKFDIIITDYNMPDMTGLDFAQKLLEIRPELPIIMYTGDSVSLDDKKVKSSGIRGVLGKPLEEEVLVSAICRALENG